MKKTKKTPGEHPNHKLISQVRNLLNYLPDLIKKFNTKQI